MFGFVHGATSKGTQFSVYRILLVYWSKWKGKMHFSSFLFLSLPSRQFEININALFILECVLLAIKFGACYMRGQWEWYFHILLRYFFVFHHKISVFYNFISFFWWSIKFSQQNSNQLETGLGDKKLSVKLYI